MIKVNNLCKSYRGQQVLTNYSREFNEDINLIKGESGTGKTTLLKIIMGLIPYDSGEVIGNDIRFSAVFQEDRLLNHLDAEGNLRFVLGKKYNPKVAENILMDLGLDLSDKKISQYSGGMKRRLCIARALLAESDCIVLDEPFTGLDIENVNRAKEVIQKYRNNRPVLLVTHIEG